jgi:hypothetical protein
MTFWALCFLPTGRFIGTMKHMRMDLAPQTCPGRWSVGIGIALVVLTALSVIFAIAIGGDAAVIASNPALSMLTNVISFMFTLAGPLSFIGGIIAIVKYKDRSVWKPLAMTYSLTLLLFLLGEFLFPH